MTRRALAISLFLVPILMTACSQAGPAGGAAAASSSTGAEGDAAKGQYREGLAGVDFSGMEAAAKERALDIMNAQSCDCGCGMRIAECRVKDQTCPRSPGLAAAVVAGVKAGKTNQDVVAAIKAVPRQMPPAAQPKPTAPATIATEGSPIKGNPKAPVTIVEFSDFQCPFCARALPAIKQVLAAHPDVRFVYKQFPLTSIHPFALPAAKATLAAGRQGKFWEMHDMVFQNQRALDDASLKKYARDIGLDMTRFENDLADPALQTQIEGYVSEAQRLGVSGTPTFFLNGVEVPSYDPDTMSRLVAAARSGEDLVAAASREGQRLQSEQAEAMRAQRAKEAARVVEFDLTGAPIKGDPKAPVTIVEFADFQCPYCATSVPLIQQVMQAYPGKVKLAFKHMPLGMHQNAIPAAAASIEAMEHGKFWEMHDLLFQNYTQLTRENIANMGRKLGLDETQLAHALDTSEHSKAIAKDVEDSQKAGVTGTPTFYVNGRKVMQRDFATFKKMIDDALAGRSSTGASPTGV